MSRALRRSLQRSVRRLGLPGVVALLLLMPAVAIVAWLPLLQRHSDELRAAMTTRFEVNSPPAPVVLPRKSGAEQAAEYVAGLPSIEQNADDLERLFALAASRRLVLPKGDYQFKQEPNAPVITYSASFPVRSDYAVIKAFASDVLSALPHVSLDELRMARADAGAGVLDSMVRFTFVYRSR